MTRILTPIVAMFVSLLMLAGCQETDAQVQAALTANCPAVNQTYAIFATMAEAGVSSKTLNTINSTKATFDSLCANPETATTLSVVAAATATMIALRKGIAEAEANGADVGYPVETRQLKTTLSKLQKELDRHGR
jgi:ABC-type proline/glycine betaine transport system permease subunit